MCDDSLDLANEMPYVIFEWIQRHRSDQYTTSELCLHSFYKGRDKGNLGGVCLNPANSPPVLTFHEFLKAPQFTEDFYDRDILPTLALQMLELFCLGNCWCAGEDEEQKTARRSHWTMVRDSTRDPDSSNSQGQSIMNPNTL